MKKLKLNHIYVGDALEQLKLMPDNCIDTCVTSPPYWNLRDYGTASWLGGDESCDHKGRPMQTRANINKNTTGSNDVKNAQYFEIMHQECTKCGAVRNDRQLGLEPTLKQYIDSLVKVFDEVRRVLKPWGTCWVNIGDSYARNGGTQGGGNRALLHMEGKQKRMTRVASDAPYKEKDLLLVPFRLAIALQEAGWYIRMDNIWNKKNPMPESVTDRPAKAHEYIFLLSKSEKYFYDYVATMQPSKHSNISRADGTKNTTSNSDRPVGYKRIANITVNLKSVWSFATDQGKKNHFAVFPRILPRRCIKAGTSAHGNCAECGKPYKRLIKKTLVPTAKAAKTLVIDERNRIADKNSAGDNRAKDGHMPGHANEIQTIGWAKTCKCETDKIVPAVVLDIFGGSGTTGIEAKCLGRNWVLIELNPEYAAAALKDIEAEQSQLEIFV